MDIEKRMTLELDAAGDRDLADARDLSGSATFAATARLALLVFAALLRERRAGTRLMLERRDGEALEATLPAPARDGLEWIGGGHQRFSDLAQALRVVAASPLVSHEVRFGINGELERLASNDGAPAEALVISDHGRRGGEETSTETSGALRVIAASGLFGKGERRAPWKRSG